MNLPAEVIACELEVFGECVLHGEAGEPAAGVRLRGMDAEAVTGAYACLTEGREALDPEDPRLLICIGAPACPPRCYLQIPEGTDPLRVLIRLQEAFVRFSDYDSALARAAGEEGCQPLLQTASEILGCSVLLADSGSHVYAYASVPERDEGQQDPYRGPGGLRAGMELEALPDLPVPAEYRFSRDGDAFLVNNLYVENRVAGRLLTTHYRLGPDAASRFLCSVLAGYLERKIARNDSFGFLSADDPLYSMFYDLLSGMRVPSERITRLLAGLPHWSQGVFRVLAVPAGEGKNAFAGLSDALAESFDTRTVLMGEMLFCILHEPNAHAAWGALERRVDDFLKSRDLRGGLSNVFTRIEELHDRGQQAVLAMKFSEGERLCIYTTKMLDHILTFFPLESRHLLVHPALFRLRDYDRAKGTSYQETLRVFLQSERSLVVTAEKLFIHRNTLVYRLNKISELVTMDLDDPTQRLHLQLSYELLRSYAEEVEASRKNASEDRP